MSGSNPSPCCRRKHDDAAADLVDMAEGDTGEPVDADMDVVSRLLAAGDVEIAPAWRSAADENRVPVVAEQCFQAFDMFAKTGFDAHLEDKIDFLVCD